MTFTPRTSKYSPSDMCWYGSITDSNKWWYDHTNYNAGATANLCLPNCTTYVMGRSGEIAGKSVRNYEIFNRTGFPEAMNWYDQAIWEKGSTPKLGAIACWNSSNHVAIVEKVDGGVYLSMSGYVSGSGTRSFTNPGESSDWYFKYADYDTAVGWYGTPTGYIYNPYVDTSSGGGGTTDPDTFVVTTSVTPSGAGYVTGGGTYTSGTEVTVTAYPYSGYKFVKWSDGYTGNPRLVWGAYPCNAIFEKLPSYYHSNKKNNGYNFVLFKKRN